MATKKTVFKGFTFKKPGNSNPCTTPPSCPPVSSSSSSNVNEQRNAQEKTSSFISAPLKRSDSNQSGSMQTSITSFAKKKVAVAAVMPHRSSTPFHAVKERDKLSKTVSPIQTDMIPIEVLDDDDDFEPFPASQNFSFESKECKSKTPQKRTRRDQEPLKLHSRTMQKEAKDDPEKIPDTPEKTIASFIAESDSEEEIQQRPVKRQRLSRIIDSDGEDEKMSPRKSLTKTLSSSQQSRKKSESPVKNPRSSKDICRHPLLQRKDIAQTSGDDLHTLKDILMGIADEACDIFCKIRTCDLMNWLSSDFERLQKLLAVRKKIKDLKLFDTKAVGNRQRKNDTLSKSSPISSSGSKLKAMQSSPSTIQSPSSKLATKSTIPTPNIKEKSTPKQLTPSESFPCAESFYEKSQETNVIGNKTSEKRNSFSFNDNSFNNKVPSFGDMSASGGSFACGQRPKNVSSLNQTKIGSQNSYVGSSQKPTHSQRTPQGGKFLDESWMEDEDFADEMEAAMELESDLYGGLANLSQKPSPCSLGSEKSSQRTSNSQGREKSLSRSLSEKSRLSHGKGSVKASVSKGHIEDGFIDSEVENESDDELVKEYRYIPQFSSTDHDDGASPEFAGTDFKHSPLLLTLFRQVFGLSEFRHNQLEAINAALLGHDCFILMPTGGGKSLCYQLPAVTTDGVSIIVSPLRALIHDQTQRLLSLDIPAAYLSSDIDTGQSQSMYSGLYQRCPAFKMLYVTPEKLSASEKLLSCLDNLFKRSLLTRFVIDEAHCVSQWGHDFRPDYKRLNILRQRYPGVPMMALTATATPRVRKDINHQLGMTNPKWFMQSFNRPNLKYTVQSKKPSSATKDVIGIIKTRFKNDCGIVYCLSRKECDNLAADLKKAGLSAEPYHAGLTDTKRAAVQEKWINDDRCKIMCATIAFGMGIDKADVRFVIHYSLPKSVEGYYQEAGRAGRDGQLSHCILLYCYSDVKRMRRMIEMDQNATFDSKRVHNDNLYRMVNYCENVTDCRRTQILQYFGEMSFDRSMCNSCRGAECDNCLSKDSFNIRDVTEDAKEIVKCVKEINSGRSGNNHTLIHLLEIFKGSQNSKIQNMGHTRLALHGRGKSWTRQDAERLCRKLVIDGILKEDLQVTAQEFTVCYIKLGPRALDLMTNKIKVELPIQGGRHRVDVAKVGSEQKSDQQKVEMECLAELRVMAKAIAAEYKVKNYAVIFPESALKQLAQRTPITRNEMIDQIDHFNSVIIDKYKADRLLEITLKYSFKLAAMSQDDSDEECASNDNFESDSEIASRYFEEPSTSHRSSGGGKGKGYKRRFPRYKKGKSRGKRSTKGSSKSKSAGKQALSQFKYKLSSPAVKKASGPSGNAGPKRPTSVTKSSLGLMPDPRSRPYLASVGSYMG